MVFALWYDAAKEHAQAYELALQRGANDPNQGHVYDKLSRNVTQREQITLSFAMLPKHAAPVDAIDQHTWQRLYTQVNLGDRNVIVSSKVVLNTHRSRLFLREVRSAENARAAARRRI